MHESPLRISVIIPTLNAAGTLPAMLTSLIGGCRRQQGEQRTPLTPLTLELIVSDGGSTDTTGELARAAGARLVTGPPGRGAQLARGAKIATAPWLLFLHADTILDHDWRIAALQIAGAGDPCCAGAFRFRLADTARAARFLEWGVALRCRLFALPYGDQGLLISRRLYDEIGGFRPMPLMEDVDMIRRIGRRRLHMLKAYATTDASRYRRTGYVRRIVRNISCLMLYFAGVRPARIRDYYNAT